MRQCYVTLTDEAVRLHRLAAAESKMDLRRHLEVTLEADARAYAVELERPLWEPLVVKAKAGGNGAMAEHHEIMTCVACGCSDRRACMTEDGPCFWVEESPPVCSGCASPWPRREDIAAIDARLRLTMDQLIVGTTPNGVMVWMTPQGIWAP